MCEFGDVVTEALPTPDDALVTFDESLPVRTVLGSTERVLLTVTKSRPPSYATEGDEVELGSVDVRSVSPTAKTPSASAPEVVTVAEVRSLPAAFTSSSSLLIFTLHLEEPRS